MYASSAATTHEKEEGRVDFGEQNTRAARVGWRETLEKEKMVRMAANRVTRLCTFRKTILGQNIFTPNSYDTCIKLNNYASRPLLFQN